MEMSFTHAFLEHHNFCILSLGKKNCKVLLEWKKKKKESNVLQIFQAREKEYNKKKH